MNQHYIFVRRIQQACDDVGLRYQDVEVPVDHAEESLLLKAQQLKEEGIQEEERIQVISALGASNFEIVCVVDSGISEKTLASWRLALLGYDVVATRSPNGKGRFYIVTEVVQ